MNANLTLWRKEAPAHITGRRATSGLPTPRSGISSTTTLMADLIGTLIPKNQRTGRLDLGPTDWAELARVVEHDFNAVLRYGEADAPGTFLDQTVDCPCNTLAIQTLDGTDPRLVADAAMPILNRMIERNITPYLHDVVRRL